MEGDSAIIVNAIRTVVTPNWRLKAMLDRTMAILEYFECFTIKHVYREANGEADELSKLAAEGKELRWWHEGYMVMV